MKQMFGRADFTKMKKSPEPLYISSAVHKAFISVTEYGTEASGATSKFVQILNLLQKFAI